MKSAISRTERLRRAARRLLRDASGATMVEFTLVAPLFFVLTFGIVEFGNGFWQWNQAAKAVQLGARLAAVSSPVWKELMPGATWTGVTGQENGNSSLIAGSAWPSTVNYGVSCSGATSTCTAISGTNGAVGYATTYVSSAMTDIVYGRGQTTCGTYGADKTTAMCDLFNRIRPANVVIEYRSSGLGYVLRPEGPIPTIVVKLTGLTFQFIALKGFLGLGPIALPDFKVTITGEDVNSAAPS